jgi:hypothetical protein
LRAQEGRDAQSLAGQIPKLFLFLTKGTPIGERKSCRPEASGTLKCFSRRRAGILVIDADPTQSIWNTRRINGLIVDGNVVDRDGLLNLKH